VRLLVAKAADLDVQDQDLWTALHWAAHKGHAEIVQLLISKGADLTLRKRVTGLSVLYCGGSVRQLSILPSLCVQNGTAYDCACSEEIRALFPDSAGSAADADAVPEDVASDSQLLWAAANANDLVLLRELPIKTDADVNWVNEVRFDVRC
jgi:ankyrin repeat protein